MREAFKNKTKIPSAFDLNKQMKTEDCFKNLPAKTSQQIIIKLGNNWHSFYKSCKRYNKDKTGYCGEPRPPKFKDKKKGRNIVFFDYMQGKFEDGRYYFPVKKGCEQKEFIETNITKENFVQLQIVPYGSCYKICVVYKTEVPNAQSSNDKWLAIDLGVSNLATLTNNAGLQPVVINGRILKSVNVYFNKLKAQAQSYAPHKTTKRIRRIDLKRNNIINTHMHKISRWIVNYCVMYGIGNIVIGRNSDWKRNVDTGSKNNQHFYYLPFEKLISMIQYKAENEGIKVQIIDEKYTSKSSFIDGDFLPDKLGNYSFSGKRVARGKYVSKDGIIINADVNGSYNILRKCNPEFSWDDRIKGISLYPVIASVA